MATPAPSPTDPVLVLDAGLVVIAASAPWLEPGATRPPVLLGRSLLDTLAPGVGSLTHERLRALLLSLRSELEKQPGRAMAVEIRDVSRAGGPRVTSARQVAGDRDVPVVDASGAVVYVVRVAVCDDARPGRITDLDLSRSHATPATAGHA